MQDLTVDFVKQGLAGYGIADFISEEYIAKSIKESNGLPNFVAAPVNIMYKGSKLSFKAVNYKNQIYVSVQDLAKTLNVPVKIENGSAVTAKNAVAVDLFSQKPYIHLTDVSSIFDITYSLNKNYTVATLTGEMANPVESTGSKDIKITESTAANPKTDKQIDTGIPQRENSINAQKELYKSVDKKIKQEEPAAEFENTKVNDVQTSEMGIAIME